ncbi:hypothetical protein BBP40_011598 [Aspergillus hancockii]|nr:hypothetical protein BBP40_011598 [Aspergillus hancockii]
MASTDTPLNLNPHHHVVKIDGAPEGSEDHGEDLIAQLKSIPSGITALGIEEETPSNKEWAILGSHFPNIQSLELDTGYQEMLNDEELPLHWPLERYKLSSACGELIQSPHIRQGRVNHLILLLTSGLRFEGPTTKELVSEHKKAIARGEAEAQYITVGKGTSEEKKIELTWIPDLVHKWLHNKYDGKEASLEEDNHPPPTINLRTLEILENDAIDTFCRMTVALPHLIENLTTLNLRSTHCLDFHFTHEGLIQQILPQLDALETLQFSVGEVFEDQSRLNSLYTWLPPNLSTLRFRGPASLIRSKEWENWIKAFESKDFLPHLKRLSFVLDLYYEPNEDTWSSRKRKEKKAPEQVLDEARAACEPLYEAARQRGIVIERLYDHWSDECQILRQVDERWLC